MKHDPSDTPDSPQWLSWASLAWMLAFFLIYCAISPTDVGHPEHSTSLTERCLFALMFIPPFLLWGARALWDDAVTVYGVTYWRDERPFGYWMIVVMYFGFTAVISWMCLFPPASWNVH